MYISPFSPSPTTLSFTISTSPLLRSTRHSILLLISALLRTILILLSALLGVAHYLPNGIWNRGWYPWIPCLKDEVLRHISATIDGIQQNGKGLEGLTKYVVKEEKLLEVFGVTVILVVIIYGWFGDGKEEGLLLVRHLGVQTSTCVISPLPIRLYPPSISFRRSQVREITPPTVPSAPPPPPPPPPSSSTITTTATASKDPKDSKDALSVAAGATPRPSFSTKPPKRLPPSWLRGFVHSPSTRFIPTSSVQDIFIHEGFRGFEVKFYLSVVVRGEEDVVVVFPEILPRRRILEGVWRGARTCLFEREDEGWRERCGVGTGVVKEVEGH